MAQTTEAACLLQTGAMYPRRIGFRTADGGDLFAGVKPGAVSIYFGDAPIYHFDLDGRWQRSFIDGVHYLKGLDTTVRSIDREREQASMVLRRQTLTEARTIDLDHGVRSMALDLIDDLDSDRLQMLPTPANAKAFDREDFTSFLQRVVRWDGAAWLAQRELYDSNYGPLPFLPPDCLNALILQGSQGRINGREFGGGNTGPLFVRSPEEFREHCHGVKQLVGRRLAQCRGIFLAGADLLFRPVEEVVTLLEIVAIAFRSGPEGDSWDNCRSNRGAIHAFVDDISRAFSSVEDWRKLQAAGLERVTLGVESGDSRILGQFEKTWRTDDLRGLILRLKDAGIGVGLAVLIGSGGRPASHSHVTETASLVASLSLEAGDLVSLDDIRGLDEAFARSPDALTDEETRAQVVALKEFSAAAYPSKGPKLVAYNPDKQWK